MQSLMENNLTFGVDINWPKEFPELRLIDESLRCSICYEYFKTVMVTPCAHSYCSICIRRYLSYKTACPICFEETYETGLRNNRVLDRMVELFTKIRDKLIKHLKIAAIHFDCTSNTIKPTTPSQSHTPNSKNFLIKATSSKESSSKASSSKASCSKGKLNFSVVSPSTSSSSKKSEISKRLEDILGSPVGNGPTCSSRDLAHPVIFDDCERNIPTVPSMFLKDPPNQHKTEVTLVNCPVCSVGIPERNINVHLDNCLANIDKPVKSPVSKHKKRSPLPKRVWNMMAEKDLRKMLKEYGLSVQGDKKALVSRLQRYVILYNSECDSENPRSVSDIIRQVEREDKSIPVQGPQRTLMCKKVNPKTLEEEHKKYIKDNKDSFNKLIEAMREREGRNIKPLRPINRLSSDEDEGGSQTKDAESEGIRSNPSDKPVETVNLCESRSSSPVLDSWVDKTEENPEMNTPIPRDSCEKTSHELSSEDIFLNENSSGTNTPEKVVGNDSAEDASDLCDADNLFQSSPIRPPSPSCIITARSDCDSEDSISILINQNVECELLDSEEPMTEDVEPATGNAIAGESQLNDPDYVLNTEDQDQGDSEEVFVPKRKSKRKQNSPVNETPSPRRTRRRFNK